MTVPGTMDTHHLETIRTARFHTLGDPERCCEVWYLLHGYGQSAAGFLDECEPLLSDGRLLVAPEALSRFYLRSGRGPVGASWMTREERALEIADYLRYLDLLARQLPQAGAERRACVLGFSQGAATAWRWASLAETQVDRLILWAGGIPPDLDLAASRERLRSMRIDLVRGTQDEAFDEQASSAVSSSLAEHGIGHGCQLFEGDHRVDGATLRQLADR